MPVDAAQRVRTEETTTGSLCSLVWLAADPDGRSAWWIRVAALNRTPAPAPAPSPARPMRSIAVGPNYRHRQQPQSVAAGVVSRHPHKLRAGLGSLEPGAAKPRRPSVAAFFLPSRSRLGAWLRSMAGHAGTPARVCQPQVWSANPACPANLSLGSRWRQVLNLQPGANHG